MSYVNDFFEEYVKRARIFGPIIIITIPCTLFLIYILSLTAETPDFKLIRKGVTKLKVTKCDKEIIISDPVLLKVFFDDLEDYSKIKHKSFIKNSKSIDTYYCQFRHSKGKSKIEMCFNSDGSFDFIISGDFNKDSYATEYTNIKLRDFIDYNIKPQFQCSNK